jgi:hypothetical protein
MSRQSDHETAGVPSNGFAAGLLLLTGSALEILAMAHHPSVTTPDIAEALTRIGQLSRLGQWVHGILIALLLVTTYGVSEFVMRSGPRRPLIRAGAIVYFAGVIVMIGAALVSGWIVGNLVASTPHATDLDRQINAQLLALCGVANRACASVAAVAMSAGIASWSLHMLRNAGAQRVVGLLGGVVGLAVPAALIGGLMRLDVHGMSVVVTLQSMWGIAVGVLLMRKIL